MIIQTRSCHFHKRNVPDCHHPWYCGVTVLCIYIYIYIYRERERERKSLNIGTNTSHDKQEDIQIV